MALDEVDCLGHGQVVLQVVHVHHITHLLLFHLVLIGNALDLSIDVLLGSDDILSSGNSLQSQTDLDLLLSLRHESGTELLHGLTHILQVVLQTQTLLLHTESKVVDHFVHADMTLDEFREAQARKGESIAGLMLKSVLSSLVEKTGTNRAGEFGLMADFLAGNKTGLKNKLMGMMANAPNGLENTVILEGRNAKCMEVFDRWSGKGVRRIGVFYGAAHLPGLHGALLERGYRLREVRWLPAWSTREQGADGQRGEG